LRRLELPPRQRRQPGCGVRLAVQTGHQWRSLAVSSAQPLASASRVRVIGHSRRHSSHRTTSASPSCGRVVSDQRLLSGIVNTRKERDRSRNAGLLLTSARAPACGITARAGETAVGPLAR
jgi:hypothetical protein